MDSQTFINIVAGAMLALLGWLGRILWEAVTELRTDLHRIEVDLPSSYVKKEELSGALRIISDKLDKIWDKLDDKADKKAI